MQPISHEIEFGLHIVKSHLFQEIYKIQNILDSHL